MLYNKRILNIVCGVYALGSVLTLGFAVFFRFGTFFDGASNQEEVRIIVPLVCVFISVGGIFAIWFFRWMYKRKQKEIEALKQEGVGLVANVTECVKRNQGSNTFYYLQCDYAKGDGSYRTFESRALNRSADAHVGSTVKVWCDRNDESKYYVDVEALLDTDGKP